MTTGDIVVSSVVVAMSPAVAVLVVQDTGPEARDVVVSVIRWAITVGFAAFIWRAAVFLTSLRNQINSVGEKLREHADRVLELLEQHDERLDVLETKDAVDTGVAQDRKQRRRRR